jgi:uncharacterized protein involved in exopolysaccharide biosynthesis
MFAALGVSYALLSDEIFRVEVVLSPAEKRNPNSATGQLSGLANLAGLPTGLAGTQEPLATLRSRAFARKFIVENDLLPEMYPDKWDPVAKRWLIEGSEEKPDIREAVQTFQQDLLGIAEDKKAAVVTVTLDWTNPSRAAELANRLVARLNADLRDRAAVEAERNIAYLKDELSRANVVSLQQSVSRVLESEMQKLMLARGNDEFAFKVIDPASPPLKRHRPQRAVITVLFTFFGFIVGSAVVLFRSRKQSEPQ